MADKSNIQHNKIVEDEEEEKGCCARCCSGCERCIVACCSVRYLNNIYLLMHAN